MLKIDLHVHSIHSGHAYGTFYDIIEYAAKKKMKMIAITDHGPSVAGSAAIWHFRMGNRAPKTHKGVKLLWGCEANIINEKGDIDLDKKTISELDLLLANVHTDSLFKDGGKKKNTAAIINSLKKYPISILSHPSAMFCSYDLEKVCQAACDNNVLLEINISGIVRMEKKNKKECLDGFKTIVDVAKKNKKKIIVNSDAHFLHEIGDDSILKKYKPILGLTDDMIINNYPKELDEFLKSKKINPQKE